MQETMEPPLIVYFNLLRKQSSARNFILVSDDASSRQYMPNSERESERRQIQSSLNEKNTFSPNLHSLESSRARGKSVGHPTMPKRDPRCSDTFYIHHPELSGSDDDEPPQQPTRVASNENLLLKSSKRWTEKQRNTKATFPGMSVGRSKKGSAVLKKFFDEVTPTAKGKHPKSRSTRKSASAQVLSKERPALSRQQNLAPLKPPIRKKSADDLVTTSSHRSTSWSVTNSSSSTSSNDRFELMNWGRKRKEPEKHHKWQKSPIGSATSPGQPLLPSATIMLGTTECFVHGFSDKDVKTLDERKRSSMGKIAIPQRSNSEIICWTVVAQEA